MLRRCALAFCALVGGSGTMSLLRAVAACWGLGGRGAGAARTEQFLEALRFLRGLALPLLCHAVAAHCDSVVDTRKGDRCAHRRTHRGTLCNRGCAARSWGPLRAVRVMASPDSGFAARSQGNAPVLDRLSNTFCSISSSVLRAEAFAKVANNK